MYKVIDCHCDLLSYLSEDTLRSPQDAASRASYPQQTAGGVYIQTLAIFTQTRPGSTQLAQKQVDLFKNLPRQYPLYYSHFCDKTPSSTIQVIAAIENASGFAEEIEPITTSLARLEKMHAILKNILYISLTWNEENRFGGGNETDIGLKDNGKRLLEWMQGKHIAIDFSHTSDRLAEEILNYIDQQNLKLQVLASHSNFRSVTSMARNLPDWLAQEIIKRKGVIGLNLFGPFIHPTDPAALIHHIECALALKGEDALCFGADFFHAADFPALKAKYNMENPFFPVYSDASCYPFILEKLKIPDDQIKKIASENALHFIKRLG